MLEFIYVALWILSGLLSLFLCYKYVSDRDINLGELIFFVMFGPFIVLPIIFMSCEHIIIFKRKSK